LQYLPPGRKEKAGILILLSVYKYTNINMNLPEYILILGMYLFSHLEDLVNIL
jgi:hypothetical protein